MPTTVLRKLIQDIAASFRGRNLSWHILACALTALLVLSGFDAWYFAHTRDPLLFALLIPSAPIGGLVPILVPLGCLVIGWAVNSARTIRTGWAVAEAAFIGMVISMSYKAFTGRLHPAFEDTGVDLSHGFQFGLLRGGVFWGWPSSHTTVAFAIALTLCVLYPKNKLLRYAALAYAAYIGIGVSATIHWFSEFAAGAIIGSVIGRTVGRAWGKR